MSILCLIGGIIAKNGWLHLTEILCLVVFKQSSYSAEMFFGEVFFLVLLASICLHTVIYAYDYSEILQKIPSDKIRGFIVVCNMPTK